MRNITPTDVKMLLTQLGQSRNEYRADTFNEVVYCRLLQENGVLPLAVYDPDQIASVVTPVPGAIEAPASYAVALMERALLMSNTDECEATYNVPSTGLPGVPTNLDIGIEEASGYLQTPFLELLVAYNQNITLNDLQISLLPWLADDRVLQTRVETGKYRIVWPRNMSIGEANGRSQVSIIITPYRLINNIPFPAMFEVAKGGWFLQPGVGNDFLSDGTAAGHVSNTTSPWTTTQNLMAEKKLTVRIYSAPPSISITARLIAPGSDFFQSIYKVLAH